jgi:tRNA pseudouridine65 synthase
VQVLENDAHACPMTPTPTLIHLDDALVAVNKPSGLSVHRGWANEGAYAVDWVRASLGVKTVHPVHRLDRPTSGVLVFARSPEVARLLGEAWSSGRVAKRYLALTRGIPPEELLLDHPVKDEDGERRPAITLFRRLWVFRRRYALVEALPRTGRTHQIRRHLKHLSCPIIGDANYGKSEHNRLFASEFALSRLALHALDLALPHPITGEPLTLRAPIPEDLAGPLLAMGCPLEALLSAVLPLALTAPIAHAGAAPPSQPEPA